MKYMVGGTLGETPMARQQRLGQRVQRLQTEVRQKETEWKESKTKLRAAIREYQTETGLKWK
jgi:hypothetical protein